MIIIMLLYYEEALSANNENMDIVKYIHIVIALSFLSISNLASVQTYFPPKTNKCNLYVYDVLKKQEQVQGFPHFYRTNPPTAADWANPKFKIPGWVIIDMNQKPMSGDVVAVKEDHLDATGHVGIVIGTNLTSS